MKERIEKVNNGIAIVIINYLLFLIIIIGLTWMNFQLVIGI